MSEDSDSNNATQRRKEPDSTGEFFSVGTPLHAVRAGYVQREADDVLYQTILSGRYAHVIAPRRSGKSSLIAATAARLESAGYKIAILDLEQIGDRDAGGDAGRWYYSVAYRLLRQLRIRVDLQTWWQDKSILSNRQRLFEFYSEIVLSNVSDQVVVFIDEVQCIGQQAFGDQLLASVRAAHNARATDPEFARLTFVLLGECDPLSLLSEPELSPFNVTQAVTLRDFSRDELNLFATELNLSAGDAAAALDRVYYWTAGQPYLSQKLCRAVAREGMSGDIAGHVDRIVSQQLTGRNALHNEPHLSHIHREIVNDRKRRDRLLNLYGRVRKGVHVATDLGSSLQRRLIAIGLLRIDADGNLAPRNRVYEAVFTAHWANRNLPNNWRAPLIAAAVILVIIAVPFWYSQLLPGAYVETLTSDDVELAEAREAFINFSSFPGHREAANNLYRRFLERRAEAAADAGTVASVAEFARELPDAGRLPEAMVADYWQREAAAAIRLESRDAALLATLESLVMSTPRRRAQAAGLVADDYPQLVASLPDNDLGNIVFNPGSILLTAHQEARVSQWSLAGQELQAREPWTISALEISPLLRRVIVNRGGEVSRAGLTLNLSHARVADLRIKVIAPSGRTIDVTPAVERASANEDIRIPASQLRDLVGEPLNGTWTLSVRDEEIGVAGQLVGWNLTLNAQGLIEDFQRGLNIPDPVERDTEDVWFSNDGRYAVARAMQSDSARIWDVAFARPVRAIAVSEAERIVGLGAGARQFVTATQDTANIWETVTGGRVASLEIGAAVSTSRLTDDGAHLFVQRRGDIDTTVELWSLATAEVVATIKLAGTPALIALDERGSRLAIADFDRAVRVWDLASGELIAQIDLTAQPSEIRLTAGGDVLGVVFGGSGAGLWRIDAPSRPIVIRSGAGRWQLAFSPSGTKALLGRPGYGFRVYQTADGLRLGPALGTGSDPDRPSLLGFSADEQLIVTSGAGSAARIWRAPPVPVGDYVVAASQQHTIWPPSGDAVAVAMPDAKTIVVGDAEGDVHLLPVTGEAPALDSESVSFLGHSSPVSRLAVSPDGSRIASAAEDNSVRIWDAATGLPESFFQTVPGNAVETLEFSADASLLGIVSSNRVHVMDSASGEFITGFELAEPHQAAAFVNNDQLFLGNESGMLRVVSRQAAGTWAIRGVWQGDFAIRLLAASPRTEYLVLVDANQRALQFSLAEGRPGPAALQLPAPVQDVAFAPGGARLLLRTPAWIHRANSAPSGLVWLDAALAPAGVDNAGLVFSDPATQAGAALANPVFVPVGGDGLLGLQPVYFTDMPGPGLFGTRAELLAEWRGRLGRVADTAP